MCVHWLACAGPCVCMTWVCQLCICTVSLPLWYYSIPHNETAVICISLLLADFKHLAKAVTGITLDDHLVKVVFAIFDENSKCRRML